ncbi:MAG: chemotaxis protein CheB, partial [Planctomycetes bacterium]|nr:chemotaxis protein CheB [Planctomycetota bacterium]
VWARSAASRPTPEIARGPVVATGQPSPPAPVRRRKLPPKVVGIGASTGGPQALTRVLPRLPAAFPLPILLVQHMPTGFTASMAASLDRECALNVREAQDGDPVRAGTVLIAPGGLHMGVVQQADDVVVRLSKDPPEQSCRPAVDYLFRSLCETFGGATLAVIMTGMGEDGLAGCHALHAAGARILAQDAASCTVFGMPRGPIEAGIADAIVPLEELADRISESAVLGALS